MDLHNQRIVDQAQNPSVNAPTPTTLHKRACKEQRKFHSKFHYLVDFDYISHLIFPPFKACIFLLCRDQHSKPNFEKMMDSNELIAKEKLEFVVVKESLKIPAKNPTFILLCFLTSLPALCFFLWQRLFLHQLIYVAAADYIAVYDPICAKYWPLCSFPPRYPLDSTLELMQRLAPTLAVLAFSYLTIGHFLNLVNTVVVVYSASTIYAEKETGSLKEMMFVRPFRGVGSLTGPYITSIYKLAVVSLILAGVASFVVQMVTFPINGLLNPVLFGLLACALLVKYLEWSAVWNAGLVVSILEGKHGIIGIGVAGYISRGCRRRGFLLMLVFMVWRVFLRMVFWYYGNLNKDSGSMVVLIAVGEGGLVWFGEVINWIVCTVYYYDCKRRFLEKKVDLEKQGSANLVLPKANAESFIA